jgi:hypothetical protein
MIIIYTQNPVTSAVHTLGYVNGFHTCAVWVGPTDDHTHWIVEWLFIGFGEQPHRVQRTYDIVEKARYAFRSPREMVEDDLRADMLAAVGLPF